MPNATIEGLECTLFFDYDFHRDKILQRLSDDGRIEWLEKRMHMIFLDPLKPVYDRASIAHCELHNQPSGQAMTPMLMALSLLMNGIEALGSFLVIPPAKDRKKNYRRFNEFIVRYMKPWTIVVVDPNHGSRRLSDLMWQKYRNGLTHSFAILHAGIDDAPGVDKTKVEDGVLQIDHWKFFADFVPAVDQMFLDVRSNPKLKKVFLRRFKEVYQ